MIWEDVLSFTTIHIYEDDGKGLKSSICRTRFNDHTYGTTDDRTHDSPNSSSKPHQHWHDTYRTQHHPTCRLDTAAAAAPSAPSPPNLSLLATCSAIHAETALLPFALNTLSFYHDASLPPFVRRLAPAQAHAIASVALPKAGAFDFGGPRGGGAWRALAGLRRLSVVVQVAGSGFGACVCEAVRGLERGELRTAGGAGRMLFEPVRRMGLEVFNLRVVGAAGPGLGCPGLAWCRARCREVERVVLGEWAGVGWEMGEDGEEASWGPGLRGATVMTREEAVRLGLPMDFLVRGLRETLGELRRARRVRMPSL